MKLVMNLSSKQQEGGEPRLLIVFGLRRDWQAWIQGVSVQGAQKEPRMNTSTYKEDRTAAAEEKGVGARPWHTEYDGRNMGIARRVGEIADLA